MKKLNSIQFYGMPRPIYAFCAIIVLACAYFNIIPNQMIGAVAVLFAFGILIGEIGERLPIWNKFLGGGAMLCFLAAGLLKYFNLRVRHQRLRRLDQRLQLPERLHHLPRRRFPAGH